MKAKVLRAKITRRLISDTWTNDAKSYQTETVIKLKIPIPKLKCIVLKVDAD